MSIIKNTAIKAFILHYSDQFDARVSEMVSTEIVRSEDDAKHLLSFLSDLFRYSRADMDAGKIVLGEPSDDYDAEQSAIAICCLLEELGFGCLVDQWQPTLDQ